jgi:hypothetical protein
MEIWHEVSGKKMREIDCVLVKSTETESAACKKAWDKS